MLKMSSIAKPCIGLEGTKSPGEAGAVALEHGHNLLSGHPLNGLQAISILLPGELCISQRWNDVSMTQPHSSAQQQLTGSQQQVNGT